MSETYLFDGTDLLTVAAITSYEGLFDPPDLRGEDSVFAGRDGAVPVRRPFANGVLTLQLSILADTLADRNDSLRTLTRLCKLGRTIWCERRRDFTSGTESHYATLRYMSGLGPSEIEIDWATLSVAFENLDSLWYPGAETTFSVSGTGGTHSVLIDGDAPTRRITITTPGSGQLRNVDTGQTIAVSGATTVDVLEMTATGGATVTPDPDSTGGWMVFDPGLVGFDWVGGGSANVSYYPAFT